MCTCIRSSILRATSSTRLRFTSAAAAGPVATQVRNLQSSAIRRAVVRPVPEKRDGIESPADFLNKIGRSMSEHESKVGATWEELWSKRSEEFKEAGITAPKDRKYILRQMELFLQGRKIRQIKARPPKKFRGRGPRVQKGVRVR